MLPNVTIVMTTYMSDDVDGRMRRDVAERVLDSWKRHLFYGGMVRLHIADDGSSDERLEYLRSKAQSFSRQSRGGVGASMNAGFKAAFEVSPIVLYAVDDWALNADLDITPWVKTLLTEPHIGMIRLGPPHPDLTGTVKMVPEGWVLRLDRHHYAEGHRPFLVHQRFIDAYGWFAEGVSSNECERLHNKHFCEVGISPDVVLALPHPWVENTETAHLSDLVPSGGVR